ncbi:probable F-box protein [Tanacetum coccineum]|uniref:Probable F-box protein n=1 Tax=Tanacetum coccineum TaxID=301880 RepID=A0ABQ5ALD1_9ASTR
MKDTIIPWQVLDLVVNIIDPKTLATASCVSKSWYSTRDEHLDSNTGTKLEPYRYRTEMVPNPSIRVVIKEAIDDSWKLWSVAMQGGGCCGCFVYNGGQVCDKAKLGGQGGDGATW